MRKVLATSACVRIGFATFLFAICTASTLSLFSTNYILAGDPSAASNEGQADPSSPKSTTLNGTVQTSDNQPISGALVSIYSAGVRVGTSPFCPTCYVDCGKRTATDDKGEFWIPRLDPTLVFRVLVIAKGYEPKFID
jgi:hypothetical protein